MPHFNALAENDPLQISPWWWPRYQNGVETLRNKFSIAWVGCTNVTDEQQTDGFTTTYSERERSPKTKTVIKSSKN